MFQVREYPLAFFLFWRCKLKFWGVKGHDIYNLLRNKINKCQENEKANLVKHYQWLGIDECSLYYFSILLALGFSV